MTATPLRSLAIFVTVLAGVSSLLGISGCSSPPPDPSAPLVSEYPNATLTFDPGTRVVTGIGNLEAAAKLGDDLESLAEIGQASVAFVQRPAVAQALGVQTRARLQEIGAIVDPQRAGYSVVRIQQFIGNVPLFGADIAVSIRNAQGATISSIAGRASTVEIGDTTAAISPADAQRLSQQFYASVAGDTRARLPKTGKSPEPQLVFFDPKRFRLGGEPTLAWRARVSSIEMFINGRTGQVIFAYDTRHAVRNRVTLDCANTMTCTKVLDEQGPTVKPPIEVAAQQIHEAAGVSHSYFQKRFLRDGFDDVAGTGGTASIVSHIRVSDLEGAQWLPEDKLFEYGDGWTVPDIAAHEYVHAVTQFGPALVYMGESGAVNEFFSDFFSVMVERLQTGRIDWRIGESVREFSAARPVRNMADPHNGGFNRDKPYDLATNSGQPSHYTELVGTDHEICKWFFLNDNGCVHFNGGILAKAAQLAVDGGKFHGTDVTAIGADKVEQIYFRTWMLGGITSSSGLKETADGAVTSCAQLVGRFGISSDDCTAFAQSLQAVGLR